MKQVIPEYASVIVVSSKGELLLQLRDNNPTIADPDCLSVFAGRIELGETREQAARRELLEETELDAPDLVYLFTYQTDMKDFGRLAKSHVFFVKGIDETLVRIHEGQGYRKIKTLKDLENSKVAPISRAILEKYFQEFADLA